MTFAISSTVGAEFATGLAHQLRKTPMFGDERQTNGAI
jgi:hypothetical protein